MRKIRNTVQAALFFILFCTIFSLMVPQLKDALLGLLCVLWITISFVELLRELHKYDGNLEVSFASKLIATIDTSKPIWDQYVVANLGLKKEWEQSQKLALKERIQLADSIYSKIQLCYQEIIHSPEGQQCIDRFDCELPKYKNIISDTKKIDFFLWSKR